ncbi:DsbA family protein [Ornithinimicrobium sufpigmenti]|uniref:DsbA family protein n=1 Tax=Ornithinimicrobium sufpigmenti TaxID=2508882 RepID=UPI001036730B|nr:MULTISPECIES: thioredoxin domain-containing protein [unclassified Ornithinimicrobium]
MRRNVVVSGVLIAAFALVVVVVALATRTSPGGNNEEAASTSSAVSVVRKDSHVLSDAGEEAPVLVEFLDFECEACGAAYPFVEQVREEYAGELTFVVRYFPIPSHANSMNAAVAVEAAAQQGRFEEMYARMFQTQTEWGEQQESKAPLFREFAEDLGLDMEAYDAAVADPAAQQRVEQDRQDGMALGVQGTPTFFLDGELLRPTSEDDFRAQIDAALNG